MTHIRWMAPLIALCFAAPAAAELPSGQGKLYTKERRRFAPVKFQQLETYAGKVSYKTVQKVIPVPRDPVDYRLTTHPGSTVKLYTQSPSKNIVLPQQLGPGAEKKAEFRRIAERRFEQKQARLTSGKKPWTRAAFVETFARKLEGRFVQGKIREAVRQAEQWKPWQTHQTDHADGQQDGVAFIGKKLKITMPTFQPVKAIATYDGKVISKAIANVAGKPMVIKKEVLNRTERVEGLNQVITYTEKHTKIGGFEAPGFSTWANAQNLFLTPSLEVKGKPVVKVRNLGGIPRGAEVTITNVGDKAVGRDGATVVLGNPGTKNLWNRQLTRHRSWTTQIGARPGDMLKVAVSYHVAPARNTKQNKTYDRQEDYPDAARPKVVEFVVQVPKVARNTNYLSFASQLVKQDTW